MVDAVFRQGSVRAGDPRSGPIVGFRSIVHEQIITSEHRENKFGLEKCVRVFRAPVSSLFDAESRVIVVVFPWLGLSAILVFIGNRSSWSPILTLGVCLGLDF